MDARREDGEPRADMSIGRTVLLLFAVLAATCTSGLIANAEDGRADRADSTVTAMSIFPPALATEYLTAATRPN